MWLIFNVGLKRAKKLPGKGGSRRQRGYGGGKGKRGYWDKMHIRVMRVRRYTEKMEGSRWSK
jgi:hypothetical protein